MALLKYSAHNTQFTHLKCAIQRLLVSSELCIHHHNLLYNFFLISLKRNPYHLVILPNLPSLPPSPCRTHEILLLFSCVSPFNGFPWSHWTNNKTTIPYVICPESTYQALSWSSSSWSFSSGSSGHLSGPSFLTSVCALGLCMCRVIYVYYALFHS